VKTGIGTRRVYIANRIKISSFESLAGLTSIAQVPGRDLRFAEPVVSFPFAYAAVHSLHRGKPLWFSPIAPLGRCPFPSAEKPPYADKGKQSFPLKSSFRVLIPASHKIKNPRKNPGALFSGGPDCNQFAPYPKSQSKSSLNRLITFLYIKN